VSGSSRKPPRVQRVNPPELGRPSGFSHATIGTGRIVFLAGQTSLDPSGTFVGGTVVEQFERALGNLLTALRAAGGSPADLASLTIYLVDVDDYRARAREIGQVWTRLAGSDYPAMAAVGVTRLWDEDALVEIQGFAVLGGSSDSWPFMLRH
jgi:enamine deaminase RidA (YjgF/YER057c/UK114 family)